MWFCGSPLRQTTVPSWGLSGHLAPSEPEHPVAREIGVRALERRDVPAEPGVRAIEAEHLEPATASGGCVSEAFALASRRATLPAASIANTA